MSHQAADHPLHVDPATESGETFHRIGSHAHDGLPLHSHR
jgi:hypothetical protein